MISRPLYHPESGNLFLGDPAAFHGGEEVHPIDPTTLPAGTRIQTTLYHSEVLPSMDFETYSEAGFTIDPHTGKVKGMGPRAKAACLWSVRRSTRNTRPPKSCPCATT